MSAPDEIVVPVRVTWTSMMLAKLTRAASPLRLAVFVGSMVAVAWGVAIITHSDLLAALAWVVPITLGLRVGIMSLSSWLDRAAARRYSGLLTFASDHVRIAREDGTSDRLEWDWVLEARRVGHTLALRVDERGGRAFVFVTDPARAAQLAPVLEGRGKLRRR